MSNESILLRTIQLPREIVNRIEELCYELPWFYFADCALGKEEAERRGLECHPYFSHTLMRVDDQAVSEWYPKFPWTPIDAAARMLNNKRYRAHMTLQYPRPEVVNVPHNIHRDQDFPHIVGLYYVNDTDGVTFFFDEDDNIVECVKPERGKMVVFDGKWRHSSSSPSEKVRFTLNINYEAKGL